MTAAPPTPSWGLLVGYGSIGRAHLRALARQFDRVTVVDPSDAARDRAHQDLPGVSTAASLEDLTASGPWAESLAVIATWGPSHRSIYDDLVERGVRRVVCEKPLASSVGDAVAMAVSAEAAGVELAVNYTRRYMRQHDGILQLADEHGLGRPTGVVAHGGARGLVTNGIHIVELICALFDEAPTATVSTARGEHINPRSADLVFFGGTSVWRFASGREATIVLSLLSSLKETIEVYFRDGLVQLHDQRQAQVWTRAEPSDPGPRAVVQAQRASELVYDGPLPGAVAADDAIEALHRAVAAGDRSVIRPELHVRALDACLGALLAAERGVELTLPVDPASPDGQRAWPIS